MRARHGLGPVALALAGLLLRVRPSPTTGIRRRRGRQTARPGPIRQAQPTCASPTPPGHCATAGPREAGLVAEHLAQLPERLRSFLEPSPPDPMYAGGVALAARRSVVAVHEAGAHSLRYADEGTALPPGEQILAHPDTIYDLASVTKTFTAIAVLQQVEARLRHVRGRRTRRGRVPLAVPQRLALPGTRRTRTPCGSAGPRGRV